VEKQANVWCVKFSTAFLLLSAIVSYICYGILARFKVQQGVVQAFG